MALLHQTVLLLPHFVGLIRYPVNRYINFRVALLVHFYQYIFKIFHWVAHYRLITCNGLAYKGVKKKG
jgi:hypothetical protein